MNEFNSVSQTFEIDRFLSKIFLILHRCFGTSIFVQMILSNRISNEANKFEEKELKKSISLSRIFFFQNKFLINFFSCVYLSSHTVSRYPLIFLSGLGTGNGMIATQQSAAKVTYGTFIINSATHPST
ncbi:hypothetical protein BpHYR1_015736 [Brachionus plicatilis]|uniref:Uncharacterized protein n=1 Tax=Brachionus plicatilis TaxID=10195 RepID=A0A3M7RKB6_BRAPC|nr:hypothetical protein BpHYR1_015736 [Brachionus plicatilis]